MGSNWLSGGSGNAKDVSLLCKRTIIFRHTIDDACHDLEYLRRAKCLARIYHCRGVVADGSEVFDRVVRLGAPLPEAWGHPFGVVHWVMAKPTLLTRENLVSCLPFSFCSSTRSVISLNFEIIAFSTLSLHHWTSIARSGLRQIADTFWEDLEMLISPLF